MTSVMIRDLSKLLGHNTELPQANYQIDGRYNRYVWDLKILRGGLFKQRLGTYRSKNPSVDVYACSINELRRILQNLGIVIAIAAGLFHISNYIWGWIITQNPI